jgi:hypothetical protein
MGIVVPRFWIAGILQIHKQVWEEVVAANEVLKLKKKTRFKNENK